MVKSQISLEFITSSMLFVFLMLFVVSSLLQSYTLIADDSLQSEAKSSADRFVSQLFSHTGELGWSEPFSTPAMGLLGEEAEGVPYFTTLVSAAGGSDPLSLSLAFLDEDNLPDIAGVGSGGPPLDDEKIFILLGRDRQEAKYAGKGYSNLSSGLHQFSIAAGDINGDGYVDIIASSQSADGMTAFLGNGQGQFSNFTLQSALPLTSSYRSLKLDDFNGDLYADLLAVNRSGQVPVIFYNLGNGTFGQENLLPSTKQHMSFDVGDFNSDGSKDIVGATSSGITLFINDGAGSFTEVSSGWNLPQTGRYTDIATLDANGDGLDDAVFSRVKDPIGSDLRGVYLFLNNGNSFALGAWIESLSTFSFSLSSVVADDFNGDSYPDIAFSTDANIELFLNDGTGSYTNFTEEASMPTGNFRFLAAGDLNGDKVPDLLATQVGSNNVFQLVNEPVFFQKPMREQPIKYDKLQKFAGLSFGQAKHLLKTSRNYRIKVSYLPSLAITSYYENEVNISSNQLLNTFSNDEPVRISFEVVGSSSSLVPKVYTVAVGPSGRGRVFGASKHGDFYKVSLDLNEVGIYRLETVAMTDVYYGKTKAFIEVID